jgi:hypothetical protein
MPATENGEGGRGAGWGGWTLLRVVISTAVVVLLLGLLVRMLLRSWREAGVYDWSLHGWWIAASFLLLAIYFPLVAWIWGRIVRDLGGEIRFRSACRVWFLSQLGKYVPGKIWFAMGRVALSRQEGVGFLVASVSTVLELLLVILAAGAVFLLSAPFWPSIGSRELTILPAALVVIAFIVHPVVFGYLMRLAGRVLRRSIVPPRLSWRSLGSNAGWYALSWILYGAGIDCLLRGVRLDGVELPALGVLPRLLFLSGASAVAWSIGFLSLIAPGGLGVREASLAYLLGMHFPGPIPVFLALVSRVWIMIGELVSITIGWRLTGGRS